MQHKILNKLHTMIRLLYFVLLLFSCASLSATASQDSVPKKASDLAGYEKLYVWLTPENPCKKTPEIEINDKDVVVLIKKEHPRLFITKSKMESLREQVSSDPLLEKYVASVLKQADEMLSKTTVRNDREAMQRIFYMGFAYHWKHDQKYAEYAKGLVLDICEREQWDWVHFLGASETAATVGIGYDTFYDYLDRDTRKMIRQKLMEKGLNPGVAAYAGAPYGWFSYVRHNWNLVCNTGLVIGSLAIAGDEDCDFYAQHIVPKAVKSMALAFNEYAPDGAYPEGPGYWGFATSYATLGLEALNNSLGTDFGLSSFEGFNKTFYYNWYMTAPNGNLISYADCYPDSKNSANGLLFWMANRYNDPFLAERERQLIRDNNNKVGIYDVLFYSNQPSKPIHELPCDRYFRGPVEVATMRTSWDDPNAMFASIKAGYNQVNHGHLDLGAFEFFALGEKWFYDLGSDDYLLPDFFDMHGERWKYYRTSSLSHNVPLIDNENQNIFGVSKFTETNLNLPISSVEVDLSDVYKKSCNKMSRRLNFDKKRLNY